MALVLGGMFDGDHMGRGWWWVMGLGWLVFLALVVTVVIVLVRHVTTGDRRRGGPEEALAERFARGEIDEDEYRRRLETLRSR